MFHRNQSITVDSFRFVDPEFDEFFRILELVRLSQEQALEDTRKMSNVEFVMEVDGSLSERGNDSLMEVKSSLDDELSLFLDVRLEFLEVTKHESVVNSEQGGLFRERYSTGPEMSLISGVNKEGTSSWVHSSDGLCIDNFNKGELANIIPMSIISVLS